VGDQRVRDPTKLEYPLFHPYDPKYRRLKYAIKIPHLNTQMKKLLFSLTLLLITFTLHASVIIYKTSYSQTDTGDFQTLKTNYTGYLIFGEDRSLIHIEVNPKTKTYREQEFGTNFVSNYLRSTLNDQVYCLALTPADADNGRIFLKGKVSSLDAGAPLTWLMPKTVTISGVALSGTDPFAKLREWNGMSTFDSKDSIAMNNAGKDAHASATALEAALDANGYTKTSD
jgi:hypothetical protein